MARRIRAFLTPRAFAPAYRVSISWSFWPIMSSRSPGAGVRNQTLHCLLRWCEISEEHISEERNIQWLEYDFSSRAAMLVTPSQKTGPRNVSICGVLQVQFQAVAQEGTTSIRNAPTLLPALPHKERCLKPQTIIVWNAATYLGQSPSIWCVRLRQTLPNVH